MTRQHRKDLDRLLVVLDKRPEALTGRHLRGIAAFLQPRRDMPDSALQWAHGKMRAWLRDLIEKVPSPKQKPGALLALDGWTFQMSYGVYREGDRLSVGPTIEHRAGRERASRREDGSLVTEYPDFSGLVQWRLFSLISNVPLSSLRLCPRCDGLYYATDRKSKARCRRCLQRETTRKWAKKNQPFLEIQRADREAGRTVRSLREIRKASTSG